MARTRLLQSKFLGMVQDQPRYALPEGRVWNMQDMIPNLDASVSKRGGLTNYNSTDIASTATSATYINSVMYAPFATPVVLATTDNSKVVKVSTGGTVTSVTASGVTCVQAPVYFAGKVVFPVGDGSTAPTYYDGTTYGNLAGSPPAGKYAVAWKNFLALGGASATNRRTYWSALTDPTSWNTTLGWFDVGQPITGYAPLPNALLVFQEKVTTRIRGSIAPPGGDFAMDDQIFQVGCTDARSIAVNGPVCCFANPAGVYLTNGTVSVEDLTASCGVKKLWQSQLSGYTSSYTIAGGFYRNLYYVSVMNGSTFVDSFVFDPVNRVCWRNTNFKHRMYFPVQGSAEELLAASRSRAYVEKVSATWSPSSSQYTDADLTSILPVLETRLFDDMTGSEQRIRDVWVRYYMPDAAGNNPAYTVSVQTNSEGSYTALSPTLVENTEEARVQIPVRMKSFGFGLKLTTALASEKFKLVALEATVYDREGSR